MRDADGHFPRRAVVVAATVLLSVLPGCVERPPVRRHLGDALPMSEAVDIVHENLDRIRGTLRAIGIVDSEYTDENGKIRRYTVDATLFFLEPKFLRLELEHLGDRKLLVGSNETHYWFDDQLSDRFECGRHGEKRLSELLIEPKQLLDALGLTHIPTGLPRPGEAGRLQRIEMDTQQLLFLRDDPNHGRWVAKEFWLDRYEPRLIKRVLFRTPKGGVELEAHLSDYRRTRDAAPWLPYLIEINKTTPSAYLRFDVRQWKTFPQVTPGSIQFATPQECKVR